MTARHRILAAPLLLLLGAACTTGAPAGTGTAAPASATPAPPATPPKVTLRWTTATEVDNYGFVVFRGDAEAGPFRELTERIIAGSGTSEVPHQYSYEDLDVVPGKTYYYYLESVSTKGVREKFSPVISKTCCKGVEAPAK